MKQIRLLTTIVWTLLAALVLAGCGPDIPALLRHTPSPRDLPLYPGSTLLRSASITSWRDREVQSTSFVTHDPPERVREFYRSALQSDGWTADVPSVNESDPMSFFYQEPATRQGLGDVHTIDIYVRATDSGETTIDFQMGW